MPKTKNKQQRIRLPNNWYPREYQMPLWSYLERGGKRAVAVWHRRAGKDEIGLHWAAVSAMQRPAMYWHMLPEAAQARKAVWNAVNPHTGRRRIDEAFPKELRETTRDQEMFIRFKNGAVWQVVGSDNFSSLVGTPPVGLVCSEWALADPDAWAYLRPILAENDGWAVFISTPRGKNHLKTIYDYACQSDKWFAELLTADDTGVFSKDILEEERKTYISDYGQALGEAFYGQEYFCSWNPAFEGKLVFPEFRRDIHIAKDSLLPAVIKGAEQGRQVIRGWDNTGLQPACVLTYVNTLGQWFLFKEFCGKDIDIVDFGEWVKAWCGQNLPTVTQYRDIGDPAGNIRDMRKKSAADYLRENCELRIEDGVQTFKVRRASIAGRLTKLVQGEPALLVDPYDCDMVIEGFSGGYVFPEIGNTGIYKDEPLKNEFSHPHDAIQYPATIIFGGYMERDEDPEAEFIRMRQQQERNHVTGY